MIISQDRFRWVLLIVIILLVPITSAGQKVGIDLENDLTSPQKFTARLCISYIPVGTIKFIPRDVKDYFYDNLVYRVSAEYFISEYFSVGPGFEYLDKKVTVEQDYPFTARVRLYCLYLDSRYNHPLTDTGTSYLVFGMGTGIGKLNESDNAEETGFCLYGLIGLDIALWHDIGMDFLYRYQTTRMTINNDRNYRFEGSALQTGLSYRFKF